MIPRQVDPKVRKLREKADALYAERKWEKALGVYREAEERGPYDARIGQRIAELHRRLGSNLEAVENYKKAARHYAAEGFWAKAIAVSKLILEIDPNDREVRNQLSKLYSNQGKASEEIARARRVEAAPAQEGIPLSESSPEMPGAGEGVMFGNTISIASEEPRTFEEGPREPIELRPEDEVHHDREALGPPLDKFAQVPLFSEMNAKELSAVLERLSVRHAAAGSFLCEEGDVGESMFILAEGSVDVSVKEPDGSRLVLARLRGGEFFGEYSLLTRSPRNATVTARTEVELLEITRHDFEAISAEHPRIWTVLQDYLKRRVLDTIFTRSPVFRVLTHKEREDLALRASPKPVKMDDVVMAEGTEGDEMFFVKSGTLTVTAVEGKDKVLIGELGPGDYFGEIAMLTGKPRTATVRARTDAELFCLRRQDAAPVLRPNRELLDLLKTKIRERWQDKQAALASYRESRLSLV